MSNIWKQVENTFHPESDALTTSTIPPAIYRYVQTQTGWFLEAIADRFEFPYKIYGNHERIVHRVQTAWHAQASNLGVLLNGVKGTGKTVSAQLIANWALDQGMPVISVSYPIPLTEILTHLDQQATVIFDEFEKTHIKPEEQQALLTALDGMTRSQHKRLFLFTTNTKTIDVNFVDRPSRIRYCWDFQRLDEDTTKMLLDDLLQPSLGHLRPEILVYLNTRRVLSIDVVKTVINEVNTFHEAPQAFSDILNLSEQEVTSFMLEILNAQREPIKTLSAYFTVHRAENTKLRNLLSVVGQEAFIQEVVGGSSGNTFASRFTHTAIEIVAPTEDPNEWLCHVRVPITETWIGKCPKSTTALAVEYRWIDECPDGWHVPEWARKMENGETLTEEEKQAMQEWDDGFTVHGTSKCQRFLLRITPNFDTPLLQYERAMTN